MSSPLLSPLRRAIITLLSLCAAASLCPAAEPLHTLGEVRRLTPQEAATKLSIDIEGCVIYFNRRHHELIFHDGQDGIYVALPAGQFGDFQAGDRLRLQGKTQSGEFIPSIIPEHITRLDAGVLPKPHRVEEGELFSPSLGCQWVETPAVVVGAQTRRNVFTLMVEVSGRTLPLKIADASNAAARTAQLMQRPVLVRGAAGSVFNKQRQLTGRFLFVQSFDDIVPSEVERVDEAIPLRSIDELLHFGDTPQSRVRLYGVVTNSTSDGLYIRDRGGGIFVQYAAQAPINPGSMLEAEGFATVAPFRPVFRATRVRVTGNTALPAPLLLDVTAENLPDFQSELVSVQAELLAAREGAARATILQCQSGQWVFEASLPEDARPPHELVPHTLLRLTGICDLASTHSLPPESVDGFRLRLRAADGVAVLRRPPWWTIRRLLWAFSGLAACACLGVAWALLLRKKVREQTRLIAAHIEKMAVTDERQRIARELHDSLEQNLAGTSAQIQTARRRLTGASGDAEVAMELAEKMLDHCRDEARTSINDLRSIALERLGLPGALQQFLEPMAANCGATFQLRVEGVPAALPSFTDTHLLRIAHQAVANASQHAQPREIQVALAYGLETVDLEITDDGRGFDSASPPPRGHFGLRGMRERANKLGSKLAIVSAPGQGTKIHLHVQTDKIPATIGASPL